MDDPRIPEDLQEDYERCCHPDDERYSAREATLIERIAATEAQNRALRKATEIIYSTTESIPENHRSPWEDAILRIIDDARAALAATEETK